MSADLVSRVERACVDLVAEGTAVTFAGVATLSGVTRPTLYRHPELRAIVEEHRSHGREAHSLSGIVVEVELLRRSLEAVADRVRRQEEEIRSLQRQIQRES